MEQDLVCLVVAHRHVLAHHPRPLVLAHEHLVPWLLDERVERLAEEGLERERPRRKHLLEMQRPVELGALTWPYLPTTSSQGSVHIIRECSLKNATVPRKRPKPAILFFLPNNRTKTKICCSGKTTDFISKRTRISKQRKDHLSV